MTNIYKLIVSEVLSKVSENPTESTEVLVVCSYVVPEFVEIYISSLTSFLTFEVIFFFL